MAIIVIIIIAVVIMLTAVEDISVVRGQQKALRVVLKELQKRSNKK